MKRARRIRSCHGSDCSLGPHPFRQNRCIILTRIDRPDGTSEAWVTGDCQEGRLFQHRRHTFDSSLPTWYGGGFWERVSIGPPEAQACDECGGMIPVSETSEVNSHHKPECSLHPSAITTAEDR
jgi:hypothetical protein